MENERNTTIAIAISIKILKGIKANVIRRQNVYGKTIERNEYGRESERDGK